MKTYLLFMAALVIIVPLYAQGQEKSVNTGMGLGFQLNQYQRDFGFGLNVTSPHFAYERIAVRLRASMMYNESVQNSVTTWVPYSNVSLGIIGVGGKIGDYIRLYGEGGVVGLFPSAEFSSEQFEFGGYGLFGFEFFMHTSSNYFIEIGGIGTGARADKISTQPIYSNGLLLSVGFRSYLK